jgi:hypothetical protein
VQLVRDVDWRPGKGAKPGSTPSRVRACLVQQAGETAPDGEACNHCNDGKGPFSSCRVLAVDGRIMFDGACGNCGFNSGGIRCTLREGNGLVKWAREYVAKSNPHHRLAKAPTAPVSKRTRSSGDKRKEKGKETDKGKEKETEKEKETDKEKEKDDDGRKSSATPGSKGKGKEKRKRFYENDWFSNPLNDPAMYNTKNFAPAGAVYETIPEVIEALTEAREIIEKWLIKHGQLDEPEESSSSEEEENPFWDMLPAKRKHQDDDED